MQQGKVGDWDAVTSEETSEVTSGFPKYCQKLYVKTIKFWVIPRVVWHHFQVFPRSDVMP